MGGKPKKQSKKSTKKRSSKASEDAIRIREQAIIRAEGELQTAEKEKNRIQADIDLLTKKMNDIQKKIDYNEDLILRAPTVQEAELDLNRIEKAIAATEKESKFTKEKLDRVSQEYWEVDNARRGIESEMQRLNSVKHELSNSGDSGAVQQVEMDMRALENKLARSDADFRRKETEYRIFDSRYQDAVYQLDRLDKTKREAEQDVSVARRLAPARNENVRFESELENMKIRHQGLQDDFDKAQSAIVRLQQNLRKDKADLEVDKQTLQQKKDNS